MQTLKFKVIADFCQFMENLENGHVTEYCHILDMISAIEEGYYYNERFLTGAFIHGR